MSTNSRAPWDRRPNACTYSTANTQDHLSHLRSHIVGPSQDHAPEAPLSPSYRVESLQGQQQQQQHRPRPISIVSPTVRPAKQALGSIAGLTSRSRRPIVVPSSPESHLPQPPIGPILASHQVYRKRAQSTACAELGPVGGMTSDQQQSQSRPPLPARRVITTTGRSNPIEPLATGSGRAEPAAESAATGAYDRSNGARSPLDAFEGRPAVYQSAPSVRVDEAPESLPAHLSEHLGRGAAAATTDRSNNNININDNSNSFGPSLSSAPLAPEPSGPGPRPSCGNLSLDEILANLESGRLVLAGGGQIAATGHRVPAMELREAAPVPAAKSAPSSRHSSLRFPVAAAAATAAAPTGSAWGQRRDASTGSSATSDMELSSPSDSRPSSSMLQMVPAGGSRSSATAAGASAAAAATSSAQRLVDDARRRRSRDAGARRAEAAHGFEVAWLDFTYSVEPSLLEDPRWGRVNKLFHKERRTILKGLSGGFKSGQMVALMGPSGAGKTCLLESIAGVRTSGIGGRLCLRGRKRAQLVIVPQYDDFMPQFSVEETIFYGSRMKNPVRTNHRKVVNEVIEQLGLQVCRHNNIQRCSGGQRKRAAIAQELVSRPNILILDEPTSGLDSSCCYQTMKVLRDVLDQSALTDEPMAIVSTIHQPSAKVFQMFDQVYLLGKTGYMAYSGPPDELLPTIGDVTGLECPTYSNPSDFMIEIVAYDYGEEPVRQLTEFECQKAAQYVRDFERRAGSGSGAPTGAGAAAAAAPAAATTTTTTTTTIIDTNAAELPQQQESSLSTRARRGSSLALTPSKSDTQLAKSNRLDQVARRLKTADLLSGASHVIYNTNVTVPLRKATDNGQRSHPFFWHTWVHLHRSFLQAIRDPVLNNMRIAIHLGFATLLVLLYGKKSGEARGCPPVLGLSTDITDPHNESLVDLADNVGYLFMCIMLITYVSLMSTVLTFPIDIKTVGKEYKNGWYGTFTYFLGKNIADLPFIVAYPVVYCTIVWYMTNQASDHLWRYLYFMGLIILNAMNSQSFGLILGAVFVNSVTAATFLGPVITIPWYLFTGFTKRTHRLSEPFKTASKFLFTRYIFEGILDTVYGNERCNCSAFLQEYYALRDEEASRLGQLISVETLSSLDYYDSLETVAGDSVLNETLFPPNYAALAPGQGATSATTTSATATKWFERTVDAASTVFADSDNLNLASLMDTNVKASSMFSFGLDFEPTCPSNYATYVHQDYRLGEKNVEKAFVIVLGMLCVIRLATFCLVTWKIRTRQL